MKELRKYLKNLEGGISEASRRLGCSRQHLYNLLNGEREISRELAEKIEADSGGEIDKVRLIFGE